MLLKGNKTLFIFSGLSSFGIYILLILFLFYKLILSEKQATKFSKKNETLFEITMVEIPNVKENKKTEKQPTEVKIEKEISEESASRTPKQGLSISELFSKVDAPIPIEKKIIEYESNDDELAKRKKSIREKQKLAPDSSVPNISKSTSYKENIALDLSEGEYDEYYSKVHELLSSHWNPSEQYIGFESKVSVTIDNLGNFDYKITSGSGNSEFDDMLKAYLESLKQVGFPPYEKGKETIIEVSFKTKGER